MTEMNLDIYYDITCQKCGKVRSKDFCCGVNPNKTDLIKNAEEEGWRVIEGVNHCPVCAADHDGTIWKNVKLVEPPINKNWTGFNSRTKKKYKVLTKEGHIVEGYIYLNQYSSTGYAVWCGEDYYFSNVTHWIPAETE